MEQLILILNLQLSQQLKYQMLRQKYILDHLNQS